MEWIETTGKTLKDAVEKALDMLGVDDENLEYEVLVEPKAGFLGMGRAEARIRARVKPISREKPGDRRRDRRRGARKSEGGSRQPRTRTKAEPKAAVAVTEKPTANGTGDSSSGSEEAPKRRRRRGGRGRSRTTADNEGTQPQTTGETTVTTELSIDEQADAAGLFVANLLDVFEVDAQVDTVIEDDAILVDVQGKELGLLVGPRGATLAALEELTRAVVLHRTSGSGARINVDVSGYRAKRREALAAFASELAEQVKESGTAKALEPMSAADRKVVHDTCAEIDGVATVSEGEDARRRVVIVPA